MTPKEALEILCKGIAPNPTTNNQCIELCKKSLEKQIPKKIIENTETDREFIDYVCPNCKITLQQKMKQAKLITIYKYKHCIECGQALDWGDCE